MKKNKSIFAPIISGIYKKISCMETGTIKNNKKLQVIKSEFVNDYLTVEEQEMFEKRAIPMGVWWRGKGAILGCDLPNKVRCTVDRENHVYLFNIGKHYDAEDLDVENFKMVWDDLRRDESIDFTTKEKFVGEYREGLGYDIMWYNFKLSLPGDLYSKRQLIIDKIKEALTAYSVGGTSGLRTGVNVNFDFRDEYERLQI